MSAETEVMLHEKAYKPKGNDVASIIERQQKEEAVSRKSAVAWNAENNYVYVVKGKIALKSVEDKIIILLDKFKTGYECTTCLGTGELDQCPKCLGKGINRFGDTCTECEGNFIPQSCSFCKGRGTTLIIPESAKTLPTSGIIVSIGPLCKTRRVGDRVLFGAHTGYMLPFKGNVKLRIMREHEPLADIFLLDDKNDESTLADFIQIDEAV